MHQLQTNSKHQPQEEILSTRKSLVELQQTKQRPKSTVPTTSKTQPLPKTTVIRNSEPSMKPKITSNGRRTPTSSIGVNGIKNNLDTSRKLSSLPTTKRPPSMNEFTGINEPIPTIITSERADSGHGGSDEEIHRFDQRHDEHLSP
jgi:hypothetical protein